jgi:hypothetical protein|uniref:Transmembrane protein n=1 Tax=Arabidopsis thaliana TaxID=3702 RepID=Q570K9_ARATH|nr:hypothetical protein [Arabidopsis thaliana]
MSDYFLKKHLFSLEVLARVSLLLSLFWATEIKLLVSFLYILPIVKDYQYL